MKRKSKTCVWFHSGRGMYITSCGDNIHDFPNKILPGMRRVNECPLCYRPIEDFKITRRKK